MPSDAHVLTISVPPPWLAAATVAGYAAVAVPAISSAPSLPVSDLVAGAVLGTMLAVLTVLDVRSFRLPDLLTLPLILLGVGFAQALGWEPWLDRVLAALTGFLALFLAREAYYQVRGWQGLGLGDAKLFAAAGAWTGYSGLAGVLLSASVLALVCVGLFALRGRTVSGRTAMPFGPFLAMGLWLVWLYGPPL